MSATDNNDKFVAGIKARFDRSVKNIDGETASRITRTRHAALEQQPQEKSFNVWLPVGAVASLCLALVIYSLVPRTEVEENQALEEIELISDLELYENLEFYSWLEEHELPTS